MKKSITRREALKGSLALAGVGLLSPLWSQAETVRLVPTASCGRGVTQEQTEGPYFTPNTPLRTDFSADDPRGKPFILRGLVLNTACQPQAKALIELWHADSQGEYDNEGYRLRGHTFTGERGQFEFKTVLPGVYPGRTRHFHLKVQRPNGRVLTTQLYFPQDAALNRQDGIFDASLLMQMTMLNGVMAGGYQFVLG